jgi:GldL N-terminal domain
MKKTTYIIGYIAALVSAVATFFKMTHLPLTGAIIATALLLVSIYIPLFIIDKARDSAEGKTSAAHIVGALCAFLITLGVLFRIQHWPLAGTMLTVGLVGFSLIFLPMLYFQKSKQAGVNNLMNGAGALGLALFALGVITKIQHWPGQIFLFIPGVALVFLIYFPMYMVSKTIPDENKINHLRDTFFAVIIGCLILLFAWGMTGGKLLPPSATTDTTEQSK